MKINDARLRRLLRLAASTTWLTVTAAACMGGSCQFMVPYGGSPSEAEPASRESNPEAQQRGRALNKTRIYIAMTKDPPGLRRERVRRGIELCLTMPGWAFDPNNKGEWTHPERTDYWLDRHCPEPRYDGLLCLDWEGAVTMPLRAGPSHPEFQKSVDVMVRLVRYVKQKRPFARVGYFWIPLADYWHKYPDWNETWRACRPIFDSVDVLFPSVYDFYDVNPERDRERFGEYIELTLELAGAKPVYIYTWHRYHSGRTPVAYQLVPEDEYMDLLTHLVNVEYRGRKVDGIVLYTQEGFDYQYTQQKDERGRFKHNDKMTKLRRETLAREMRPGESIDAYQKRLYAKLYERATEVMRRQRR